MSDQHGPAAAKACPICGRNVDERRYVPFCSARCKQVDLGRWFSGTYRVETDESPEDAEGRAGAN
jgi:uncharacterized protein